MSLLAAFSTLNKFNATQTEALFWERSTNSSNGGSGNLNFVNSMVGGATASKKISSISGFGFAQFVVPSTITDSDAVVLMLSSDDDTNYAWGSSGNPVKVGVFYTGTVWYKVTSNTAGAAPIVGAPLAAAGQIVRIKRTTSGNLEIQLSTNAGISFSTLETFSGVITGVDYLAIKVINAVGGTSKKINLAQGAILYTPELVTLISFIGESNAGGQALNSELTSGEKLARPAIQILDNTALLTFEDLHIGVNNLIGHTGLTNGTHHGWEAGYADRVEANTFAKNPSYLAKTGQGGTHIADWAIGATYSGISPYGLMKDRINVALKLLRSSGKNPNLYVWYSQGINDAIDGTDTGVWTTGTIGLFDDIRDLFPNVPILITYLPPSYISFNPVIDNIVDQYPDCYVIQTDDATMEDVNHWDADGMKLISGRMMDTLNANYNLNSGFFPAPAHAIRMVGPGGGEVGVASPDFTVKIKGVITSAVVITPSSNGGGGTFTPSTITLSPGSQEDTFTYTPASGGSKTISITNDSGLTNPSNITFISSSVENLAWGDFLNASDGGSGDLVISGAPGGAFATKRLSGTSTYVQFTIPATPSDSEAVVFILTSSKVTDFDWSDGTNLLKIGVYYVSSTMYYILTSTAGSAVPWTSQPPLTAGTIIRLRRDTDDLILEYSTDSGVSFTTSNTITGLLSGIANPYIKVINVISGTILKSGKALSLIV